MNKCNESYKKVNFFEINVGVKIRNYGTSKVPYCFVRKALSSKTIDWMESLAKIN